LRQRNFQLQMLSAMQVVQFLKFIGDALRLFHPFIFILFRSSITETCKFR